jgi:hypothetical protein
VCGRDPCHLLLQDSVDERLEYRSGIRKANAGVLVKQPVRHGMYRQLPRRFV